MDAHRTIALCRQAQLKKKSFFLPGPGQSRLPAVKADFTDGTGNGVEKFLQIFLPFRRARVEIPRMTAEAGQHDFAFPRQRRNLRPVAFARAVDDHPGDAGFFARGEQFALPAGQAAVLQMIVRVVKFHCV